jgi:MFS family permease
MTQATGVLSPRTSAETRLVTSISAAHFVSHYYILMLPPLFDIIRADYGVSYTELGLALVAFNVVTAVGQTPAGILVDRLGARTLLIGGLLLSALAFALAGLIHSFWLMVSMFALAGVGNTVFHPADYSLLSHHIPPERVAKAFSVHTFAGMLGSTAAPVSLLIMQSLWGWRGAFFGAAALGFAVAALLLVQRDEPPIVQPTKAAQATPGPTGWRLLLSMPVMMNLLFFMLLALTNGGLQNYAVVALGALYGTPPTTANTALTGYLALTAIGVLLGGHLATRTQRHGLVAIVCTLASASAILPIAFFDLGNALLIGAMSLAGLFTGTFMPSRDMIVRSVTPPGLFGMVFGFVSTGFNIGGMIAPLIFGLAMDHGSPRGVFLLVAAFSLITVLTVAGGRARAA